MSDFLGTKQENFQYRFSNSNYATYDNTGYLLNDSSFLLAVNYEDKIQVIQGDLYNSTEIIFNTIKEYHEREKIYITAIKNLLKLRRYSNLIYELSNDIISEEEFDNELSDNEEAYLIKVNNHVDSKEKVETLYSVIQNIDEKLTEDDFMEIFSISHTFIHKNMTLDSEF
ncbi:MAG: hypothetical protein Q8R57_05900 [Bacteroidota bacterium]|nr:hypothetical protein [Bacteroidota bacterium]